MEQPAAAAGRTAYTDLPLELWKAILRQLCCSVPHTGYGANRHWLSVIQAPSWYLSRAGTQGRQGTSSLDTTQGGCVLSSGRVPAAGAGADHCHRPAPA